MAGCMIWPRGEGRTHISKAELKGREHCIQQRWFLMPCHWRPSKADVVELHRQAESYRTQMQT